MSRWSEVIEDAVDQGGLCEVTARRRYLYRLNAWLEKAGLRPSAPGEHPVADAVKAMPVTLKRRLRRALHL